jgi:hypothetical protein
MLTSVSVAGNVHNHTFSKSEEMSFRSIFKVRQLVRRHSDFDRLGRVGTGPTPTEPGQAKESKSKCKGTRAGKRRRYGPLYSTLFETILLIVVTPSRWSTRQHRASECPAPTTTADTDSVCTASTWSRARVQLAARNLSRETPSVTSTPTLPSTDNGCSAIDRCEPPTRTFAPKPNPIATSALTPA